MPSLGPPYALPTPSLHPPYALPTPSPVLATPSLRPPYTLPCPRYALPTHSPRPLHPPPPPATRVCFCIFDGGFCNTKLDNASLHLINYQLSNEAIGRTFCISTLSVLNHIVQSNLIYVTLMSKLMCLLLFKVLSVPKVQSVSS